MTSTAPASPLIAKGSEPLRGSFAAPGDKAISHRALVMGSLAVGRSTISGLLESDDVLATADALRQLGVGIAKTESHWTVDGLGVGGMLAPEGDLHFGNSSTGARLLMGLLAPLDFSARFDGGPTLTRRPVTSLTDGLYDLGARVEQSNDGHLPLTLRGAKMATPFHCRMAQPSEQIKSALILAAAQIPGISTIIEPIATRDHTEKMLAAFGGMLEVVHDHVGGATIRVTGMTELRPTHVTVPGDPSLAGYAIVAALVVPQSELVVENVLINPTRTGLIDTLLEMGGDIQFFNQREVGGEHVADLRVRSSRMKGVYVPAEHARMMIDDIPVLAMAAAFAHGATRIEGIGELREQECDRLAATAKGLAINNVSVTEGDDFIVIGGDAIVDGGGKVQCFGDHRIAMSFLVLGMGARRKVQIDDAKAIAASFPQFVPTMTALGAHIVPVQEIPR
jgi:3-phosphoshikimate 1-carboxyvinyltransferase